MKIGKKLFLTFIILSLASLLLSTAAGLFQLIKTRADVSAVYKNQSEELIKTNVDEMTDFNAVMAADLAHNYSELLNNKLFAVTRQVQMMRDYIRGLYENNTRTMSNLPEEAANDMSYLQPGVSFNNIAGEFQIIKSALDLLYDATQSDPNGGMYYYASESGFVMYGVSASGFVSSDLDLRKRAWYTGAIQRRDVDWIPLYTDARTGELNITCSTPVIRKDGRIAGVIACDILAEPLATTLMINDSEFIKYTFLLDENGDEFLGSIPNKTLADYISEQGKRETLFAKIRESGVTAGLYHEDDIMAGYALIPSTHWKVGVLIDYQKIIEPDQRMEEATRAAGDTFRQYLNTRISAAILVSLVAALLALAAALIASRKVTESITKPLTLLADGAGHISGGNLNYHIEIKSCDEIEALADAFNTMTRKLREYIENLSKVTAEKERVSTELNIAAQIQSDMLPRRFPAFPERGEFDIHASMQPAKEIGGDFYDFFLIDDDHLCVVIADVSGKSVPAALFMVIAKTLINNHARAKEEPQEVFTKVNGQLHEGNETSMFVTAWMGVLTISTGEMTFVNAGHNPPLLKRAGGTYEYLKTKKGFVLAGMEGFQYKQLDMRLGKGDTLFMYTDGVTEANNPADELYGEKRLQDSLNRFSELPVSELLPRIREDVERFTEGNPQFDDITMLALRMNQ
jgi:sigma-B regulation protein RsbU (phosphoserine phosphatase)